MEYSLLKKSKFRISRVGFGGMSLSSNDEQSERIIHRAIESGINYFDTADLYDKGENEKLFGRALKGKRQDVVLATKVGNQWRSDGSGWDWNPNKDYILRSVEKSLERLNTDYIDLYQLHGGTIQDPIDETIEAFEQLVRQGKILYYGTSSIRPNVIREYVKRSHIISVMMQYSLLDRRPEETCLPLLKENDIGVLARGSIAQGLLINKPAKSYLNYSESEVTKAAAAVRSLSGDHRTPAQTALQFVLRHPAISSAVVGIRTMKQLEEAVNVFEAPLLTEEEVNLLEQSIPANHYVDHR